MHDAALASFIHYRSGTRLKQPEVRTLIDERPLTVEVAGGGQYTIMRTPGFDRELAVGFLFTEGLIDGLDEIMLIEQYPDREDLVQVWLRPEKTPPHHVLHVTASCGLCSRQDIDKLVEELGLITEDCGMRTESLYPLPGKVMGLQRLFQQTGGSHAAALFDLDGRVLHLREDVGRHNALDKVLGGALMGRLPLRQLGLYLSGRASLEMIVKAGRARVPIVVSMGAPSLLAVELAQRIGITLCGIVEGEDIAVYSHDRRIQNVPRTFRLIVGRYSEGW